MADESLVVWPDHPAKTGRRGFASAAARGQELKAQWIDKHGNRIGRALSLEAFSELPVEVPGKDGGFSWNVVPVPIVVQVEPPAGAAQLQVRHAGHRLATLDVDEARRSRQTQIRSSLAMAVPVGGLHSSLSASTIKTVFSLQSENSGTRSYRMPRSTGLTING